MAQLRHFQLFRSASVYTTLDLAKEALGVQLNNLNDGEMALARYTGSDSNIHSVLGIVRNDGTTKTMDYFYCGCEMTNKINALDVNEYSQASFANGTLTVYKIKEVDGKIDKGAAETFDLGAYIDGKINALDVTGYKQATIGTNTITISGIKEENGVIADDASNNVTIDVDGTVSATNKLATVNTVTSAIEALDTTADVQAVALTAATETAGAKLVFNGVKEENGVIAAGALTSELQLAKVATTGTAADVAVVDTGRHFVGENVETVLAEIAGRLDAQAGGMRYNGAISDATATTNASTGDVRPGDIYLADAAFTIGTTSVEAGDMIVYKGAKVEEAVALTAENCNVIEKESDLMVTADGTLTTDAIMLGAGNKAVKASATLTETTITDAQTRAASALQSIGEGTDGDYVTTTVSEKAGEDGAKTQTVATSVTVQAVETSGETAKGLAEASDVKNYVDTKVGTAVQSVTGETATTQDEYVNVKVTATTNASNNVTLSTTANLKMAVVSEAGAVTTDGIATAENAYDIAEAQINALNADVTSDGAAVAKVEVTEANGKITDVVVTTVGAGVSYTAATTGEGATPANLAATTATGAVTGADIATIKQYVDAKANASTTEVTSAARDGIKVTTSTGGNGQTIYDVTLEVAEKAHVADTTTVSSEASNLLKVDADGKVSVSDTWDCGTF